MWVSLNPGIATDKFLYHPGEYAIALWKTELKYIWEVGKKDQPCNLSYFIGEIEGVRILIPHSCRYTYVSQMQTLGVDIQTIQSIVGYADVDMTTHYLHVQESIRQSAAEKFSEPFPIC